MTKKPETWKTQIICEDLKSLLHYCLNHDTKVIGVKGKYSILANGEKVICKYNLNI